MLTSGSREDTLGPIMPRLSEDPQEALQTTIEYMVRVVRDTRAHQAELLAKTRQLIGVPLLIGDLHSHSHYSDGVGTVADNWSMARSAGLDFFFATDHHTIEQKQDCNEPGLWWGQESSMGSHHLALLAPEQSFEPKEDGVAGNLRRAREIAPFAFFPHPVGWWPGTWYTESRVRELDVLEGPFAIEVINGANKHDRAYDQYDAAAVVAWDRLLTMGKRVTGLGASDAHLPQGIGSVWTAVMGTDAEMDGVLTALGKGHCFASEGPLVDLRCQGAGMGDTLALPKGEPVELELRAAYAFGMHSVGLVSQGQTVQTWRCDDGEIFEETVKIPTPAAPAYFRIEARGLDDRRAFGNPVYLQPA